MEDVATLQARLAALKGEARRLDDAIVETAHDAAAQRATRALPGGSHAQPTYSALEPIHGDVRGRKRAGAIRRAGAAGAAFMAVVLVCTLASPQLGQAPGGEAAELLGGAGAGLAGVPAALRAVGPELTAGEQKLFASDARRLQADEALHQKLERERAEHLLKMITSTVSHNEQHAALEKHIAQQVQEHREKLATVKQVRRSMIRGTDGVVGHPQTVFAVAGATQQQLAPGPKKGLTGEIDEAFRQHVMDQHAKNAERRQERESRFIREREASELARQSKERAVDDARERYHAARQVVIKAKDALKDALAARDRQTEKVRNEGFISEKEALAQLAPVQKKVKELLQGVETAKREWEAAHVVLENAESIGTRPELSFPAPFAHHAAQQLALAHKAPSNTEASSSQPGGFLSASAATASASSAAADAQAVSTHVSTLASLRPRKQPAQQAAQGASAARPHLMGGAKAMVAAAKQRLAIKAGLTGGLERQAGAAKPGPRTWGGEDVVAPMPAGAAGMFKAPTQALAA